MAHYDDVIMSTMASQITSLTIVYSTVYSDADQRKHQSSASLAFVWIRWIPRTKGQLRGKCFHLMTSSWGPSNYMSQCWQMSLPPYGVTRPEWVTLVMYFTTNTFLFIFDTILWQYHSPGKRRPLSHWVLSGVDVILQVYFQTHFTNWYLSSSPPSMQNSFIPFWSFAHRYSKWNWHVFWRKEALMGRFN